MSKLTPNNIKEVFEFIVYDWKRYTSLHNKVNLVIFLAILFRNPGMCFSVVYRIDRYLLYNKSLLLKVLGALIYPFYFIYTYYILDIDISPHVEIGKGLYIHNKGLIFTHQVICGENLTLIGPLTLGQKDFLNDPPEGPTLGNNVKIFTGARIIGPVNIGDNVSVGANAVVVKEIKSNCVVGGVPAKVISRKKVN